jgi:hypothetical protein
VLPEGYEKVSGGPSGTWEEILLPAVAFAVIEIDFLARFEYDEERECASEAGSGGFGVSRAQ